MLLVTTRVEAIFSESSFAWKKHMGVPVIQKPLTRFALHFFTFDMNTY